ncbi:hypothetical protein JCGZ_18417 [Jatropha curcas]|uniref:F-box domain-containing protein n=1 Tax=Jatropha curcas TaxID=180498 RepID=A0A067K138_JATCU|nr:F-box/kelch-repeat protein At3g23880 [Jatropha curcas]KDP29842.1 hypothetical protein JCGZ_18417 [Jatropha curcas]
MTELPGELVEEILLKLSVKTLLCCTGVCKYWNSLIRSPSFIYRHLSSTKDPLSLLTVRGTGMDPSIEFYLHFDDEGFNEYKKLHVPFQGSTIGFFQIVGSVNGLVCLRVNSVTDQFFINIDTLILWNPAIKRSFNVPKPNYSGETIVGFGYDSRTDDYKLVRIVKQNRCYRAQVELFSLNMGSWKALTDIIPPLKSTDWDSPIFSNGVLHWLTYEKDEHFNYYNKILGFNMSDEEFNEITLPENLAYANPWCLSLFAHKGSSSIAVSQFVVGEQDSTSSQNHLWVMKDYNVIGSWTILSTLPVEIGCPLGYNGTALLIWNWWSHRIITFELQSSKSKDIIDLQRSSYNIHLDPYVESLVLLDKGYPVALL